MYTIGLTGGIGSGKSSVSRWFQEMEIPIIDADRIVHELLDDTIIINMLQQEFGPNIIGINGKIDRRVLGGIVFGNDDVRRRLEGILHPKVLEAMQHGQQKAVNDGYRLCIWDVPLLLEAGMHNHIDEVWVVWVSPQVQIERVKLRDQLQNEEILARIRAQMSLDEKAKLADVVINNSGTWAETEKQLKNQWERLKRHKIITRK